MYFKRFIVNVGFIPQNPNSLDKTASFQYNRLIKTRVSINPFQRIARASSLNQDQEVRFIDPIDFLEVTNKTKGIGTFVVPGYLPYKGRVIGTDSLVPYPPP